MRALARDGFGLVLENGLAGAPADRVGSHSPAGADSTLRMAEREAPVRAVPRERATGQTMGAAVEGLGSMTSERGHFESSQVVADTRVISDSRGDYPITRTRTSCALRFLQEERIDRIGANRSPQRDSTECTHHRSFRSRTDRGCRSK